MRSSRKITKRQLRRITKEQHDRDVNAGWDYDPYSDPAQQGQAEVEQMQYDEYDAWVFQTGQITPAASSVMATYFVEQELTDDKEQIDTIAMGYRIDPQDVMRDIERQQAEQSAMMGESKITKRQLRRIIREEKAQILREYELYVDEKGNVYDDEGNVDSRGAAFGRRYGGETYAGTRPPWRGAGSRGGRSVATSGLDTNQIEAVEAALANKPNNFLKSILSQLRSGRRLSGKQKAIVRKILDKSDPAGAKLFEKIKQKNSLIKEQWGSEVETGSDLIDFAKAYASLGGAVQQQVDAVIAAYFNAGGPNSGAFEDVVHSQNPNAINLALQKLSRPGRMLGDEAEDILDALTTALELINS